ncbi:MAG: hypothetical protein RLN76_11210 [Phycisphaeraceae bacterium]
MVDVAEHQAVVGAVDDDADVEVDPDGPEVLVFGAIELVEAQAA